MSEKHILGLDLGTNSIGWAVVRSNRHEDSQEELTGIEDAGSRIIPMDAAMMGDFAKGNTVSQTADRTGYRGVRRLRERFLLRRERLHRILAMMGFLPEHYAGAIDRYGKFKDGAEILLPWTKDEEGRPVFLFRKSYEEMLQLFRAKQPELMTCGLKVPYDWTLYYLRQKALSQPVTGGELAWLLLNFNQKRGYNQTRSETAASDTEKEEKYYALRVVEVRDTGDKSGKDTWYDVVLENGMVYHRKAKEKPEWEGKVKEFIVTTPLDKDGQPKLDKDGQPKQSFRMPQEDDWALLKVKTEGDIRQSGLTVGEYIFHALLRNPKQKIKGGLVRVVERDFYKDELRRILDKQKEYIPQLSNPQLYADCIRELYPHNEAYRQLIAGRDLAYLLLDDTIFYQRPLKSKKSLIDECPYEYHLYKDEDGETRKKYLKCIAKSHPLFQEFRLWQFVGNMRFYKSGKDAQGRPVDDIDATAELLPDEESRVSLFDWLNNTKSIKEETLLTKYFKQKKAKDTPLPYRWNYVQDKEYPSNETRGEIIPRLTKAKVNTDFLNDKKAEEQLWHILYSVSDPTELRHALGKYAGKHGLGETFVEAMVKFPPFKSEYGAYSSKAIRRLLPLMRMGSHWKADDIDSQTRERIDHIIDGEVDGTISDRVREKAAGIRSIAQCRALPLWMACYLVYGRHSEASDTTRWTSPDDIDRYLSTFRQHSLRNPVVEQVVTETLRTVRDIWKKHGHIDEIHVEMGRDLKNPAEKRKKDTERNLQNERANLRVKALLTEFLNPELGIENVRPYSPSQQELLRICEDTAINSVDELDSDTSDLLKRLSDATRRPSLSDVKRYKLWLEQRCVSPYTGQPISLARLFTTDYEIEHVIPQSRYFDDSLSNKVICESEVNKLKDNQLGFEFIKQHPGEVVTLHGGKTVKILFPDAYCDLVEKLYRGNPAKKRKLLMDDIPAEFTNRQLNDSRYISRLVLSLLSHIVREEGEQEATSKHVIVCTGSVTDRLKKDWGINDVWNRIILPRFQRMNEITHTSLFTAVSERGHLIPSMPLDLQRGFSKKRIDHRHHTMDAIVIACTSRDHVNLLSNEAASPTSSANRRQLSHKLRRYEEVVIEKEGRRERRAVAKEFKQPWPGFTADTERTLRSIIVTFKQNLRVINKTSNHALRFVDGKKRLVAQTKGDSWAIRKPMHKETVYGEINLRRIRTCKLKVALQRPQDIVNRDLREKLNEMILKEYTEKQIKKYFADNADTWQDVNLKNIEIYYFTRETSDRFFATRKSVDTSFTEKVIRETIADTAIQKIMLAHLKACGGDPGRAFSPDGIEEMNRNITALNGGRRHQPILKVRVYEKAEKYAVGTKGNKGKKFVEAAKGTKLFFAVHEREEVDKKTGETVRRRSFNTIPLYVAIERMKQGLPVDNEATFILSPNDLVYLPAEEERRSGAVQMPIDRERIYKMVSAEKSQGFFVKEDVASLIQDKVEFSSANKMERALTGEMIKETCLPLKVDRLGHIIKIGV